MIRRVSLNGRPGSARLFPGGHEAGKQGVDLLAGLLEDACRVEAGRLRAFGTDHRKFIEAEKILEHRLQEGQAGLGPLDGGQT